MRGEPRNHILDRYLLLETHDVDEASERLGWARSHRIELLSSASNYYARISHAPLTQLSLGYLASEGWERDRLGPPESTSVVLIVLAGAAEHAVAGRTLPLTPDVAAVHSASHTADVTTADYFEALSIGLRQSAVVAEMEKCLQRPITAPVEFVPCLDMNSAAGAILRRAVLRLCHTLDYSPKSPKPLLGVFQLERSVISHLIESHRHNYTRLLHRTPLAGPWQVRAVEEFIGAHADEPLSLGDLAVIAGVSARTLQFSFRKHRGCSPMQFLRATRLERAREELLTSENRTSVSAVAARWGFLHFGRFAAEYRKRYAETPRLTVRRSRAPRSDLRAGLAT